MARGRRWTEEEDHLIRLAAHGNRHHGLTDDASEYRARLRDVARRIGRSYDATRKRASRIGAGSYESRGTYARPQDAPGSRLWEELGMAYGERDMRRMKPAMRRWRQRWHPRTDADAKDRDRTAHVQAIEALWHLFEQEAARGAAGGE